MKVYIKAPARGPGTLITFDGKKLPEGLVLTRIAFEVGIDGGPPLITLEGCTLDQIEIEAEDPTIQWVVSEFELARMEEAHRIAENAPPGGCA